MYRISGFRDGRNYCLEIHTPFEKKFHVFPTYSGCREYLDNYIWHLKMSGRSYEMEVDYIA